jgi:CMP-N-acetylneuraminic acid synthetase
LAKDDSSASDVIMHALDWFQCNRKTFDYFILLQPTSPFRITEHIDKALEIIISNQDTNALVSIIKVDQHP